jgi:hypothetical protein
VIPVVVGSSPISHPTLSHVIKAALSGFFVVRGQFVGASLGAKIPFGKFYYLTTWTIAEDASPA